MSLNAASWLRHLQGLAPELERQAIPQEPGRREAAAAIMAGMDLPSAELHPWGLDQAHKLWEPWAKAREQVERYPQDPQEPGAQVDYIIYDPEAATVTLGLLCELPSGCARFRGRACPRMAPMGHDYPHADCNYWAWGPMAELTPGLELYPEWQRFDCHKYYPLFQAHLCGEALGGILKAAPCWVWHAAPGKEDLLKVYAGFTSRPQAFTWKAL